MTGTPHTRATLAAHVDWHVFYDDLLDADGRQGPVGDAPSVLVEAAPPCAFAVAWLERWAGSGASRTSS